MAHLCYLCLVFTMLACLFIAALWSPEGKGPLVLVCDVHCDFVTFPFGILGHVWYLIVSIPDPCCLSYFALLSLSSWCLVIVVWLFLAVPYACLQFVIMVFPDHTHLLFFKFTNKQSTIVLQKLRLMQNLIFYLKDHNTIV